MTALVYEDLTRKHFLDWGCDFIPKQFAGFAERRNGNLTAIGFVWFHPQHGAWAMFDTRGDHSRAIHRAAHTLFEGVAAAGVTELFALCDETKPNARKWLERLGFKLNETGEWRLGLSGTSGSMARVCGGHRDNGGGRCGARSVRSA